jgi:hypothetical protein
MIIPVVIVVAIAITTGISIALPEIPGVHLAFGANLFVHRVTPGTAILLTKFADQVRDSSLVGQGGFIFLVVGHEDLLVLLDIDAIPWARVFHTKHGAPSCAICENVPLFGRLRFSGSGVPVASMTAGGRRACAAAAGCWVCAWALSSAGGHCRGASAVPWSQGRGLLLAIVVCTFVCLAIV